jgi:alpha-glucosidase (family GH31 glycosyl hydrolase)
MIDYTKPVVQKWWFGLMEKLIKLGVDGWWLDLNEPENEFDDFLYHKGDRFKVHNDYAFILQNFIAAGYKKKFPDKRLFLLSRSGTAGMQRNSVAHWSGDVSATWDDLRYQINAAVCTGFSGLPLWASDTGGFATPTTPELYLRWMQFSVFTPMIRPHAANMPREPWMFGKKVEKLSIKSIKLHYMLMPYLYSTCYQATVTGKPIMRAMAFEFPEDKNVRNMDTQYMFGDSLLVAPVFEQGAKYRKLYLPEGTWTDFFTGEKHVGGKEIKVRLDWKSIPVFVRPGGIIPIDPRGVSSKDGLPEEIELVINPAGTPAVFSLYEDDGETNDYKKGKYIITNITCTKTNTGTTINKSEQKGGFPGLVKNRKYKTKLSLNSI